MRDMLLKKFETCAQIQGFNPVMQGGVFVSADGLRIHPVLAMSGKEMRVDRRSTLQLMIEARRQRAANEEAAGVGAPAASEVRPQLGE